VRADALGTDGGGGRRRVEAVDEEKVNRETPGRLRICNVQVPRWVANLQPTGKPGSAVASECYLINPPEPPRLEVAPLAASLLQGVLLRHRSIAPGTRIEQGRLQKCNLIWVRLWPESPGQLRAPGPGDSNPGNSPSHYDSLSLGLSLGFSSSRGFSSNFSFRPVSVPAPAPAPAQFQFQPRPRRCPCPRSSPIPGRPKPGPIPASNPSFGPGSAQARPALAQARA